MTLDQLKSLNINREDLYSWDLQKERATKDSENWERINIYLENEKSKINQIIARLSPHIIEKSEYVIPSSDLILPICFSFP